MPILGYPVHEPRTRGRVAAPLRDAGVTVTEVPVHMRERASGESKLRGGKAVKLVVTVVGTLLLYGVWRRLRRSR